MDRNYILIAEDDTDDQFLLKLAFKEVASDIELKFVENGIDLVEHFRQYDSGQISRLPALLIVDLNMPKKNGKEALEVLTKKEYFLKFPSVIFSTTDNELEKQKCRDIGIDNFFVKPSSFASLVDIVGRFFELSNQVKEI